MNHSQLGLSTADLTGLQASLRTLLSPFDYPTVDAWRSAVTRSLRELLGADMASFAIPPCKGETEYFSEQIDYYALKPTYPEWLAICEPQFRTIERAVQLGVFNRRSLYAPYWASFKRSAYYNEFVVPMRAYDSIGVHVRAGRENRVCCLLFHHERATGRRFGRKGVELAHLILPVFKGAVRTYLQLRDHRADLTAAIDGLSEGILLADASGRPLHRNPALTQLLALDPEREALGHVIGEVAGTLARFAGCPTSESGGALPEPVVRAVQTTFASYRVRAAYLASPLDGAGTIVLVTVERVDAQEPPVSALRERFRLTERECQVAQLLTMGRSDSVIARTLGVSIHTARHHAESVRLKLGVHSRQDVEAAIRRLSGAPALASDASIARH